MYLSGGCVLTEWPFSELGMGLILSGSCPVQQLPAKGCDGCLQDRPPLLLVILSFTLPGLFHVLDTLISLELDCSGLDYWCQCVPVHVGPLELLVPSLGQRAAEEGGLLLAGITFISLSYNEHEHNMPTHTVHLSDAQTNCQHNLILFL